MARALSRLNKDTVTYLHGAVWGPASSSPRSPTPWWPQRDTQISLPEIGLGLVPGAGGTVSLPRRIGRLRTAWLAFSGCTVDAETAHAWGLVDVLER